MTENAGDLIYKRIEDKNLHDESLARSVGVLENFKASESEIRTFLKDRCIFITGGTGFLGKILIEKIIRSCPEIKALFILIRKKKGHSMTERFDKLFGDMLFSVVKRQTPNFRKKICPIEGDMEKLELGISPEDRAKIREEVSVFFNAAASVRFDEKLKTAIRINLRGTAEALKLASECKKLASIVHFSTAFSFCYRKDIDEQFYDVPIKPVDMINFVENFTDDQLEIITPGLLGIYPNTYTFSKALSEEYIRIYNNGLPVCVFRPSIVVSTYKEPLRGWAEKISGIAGLVSATGIGLLRTMLCNSENVADLVPVDMVANTAIACAWNTAKLTLPSKEPKIYNYVSSCQKPITWGEFHEATSRHGVEVPTVNALWYYSFIMQKNWYIYMLQVAFLHFLPAVFYDAYFAITGKETRLWDIYKKIYKLTKVLSYFTLRQWTFTNNNVQELWSTLNDAD